MERGKREELEVPVAVFAGRVSVTWKCIRAYQLVFSETTELSEGILKREPMWDDWRILRAQVW